MQALDPSKYPSKYIADPWGLRGLVMVAVVICQEFSNFFSL